MLSSGIDRRVGTAELGRAAAQYATLGDIQADKPLPAAVKAQETLNERLAIELSRLAAIADRLSVRVGADEAQEATAPRPAGLLSELELEQVRTSRLVTALGNLNDHLEALI